MGSLKPGGSDQTIGYRYYLSLHMGLARGPVDEIVQIDVGGVRAWPIPDGDSEVISGRALVAEGPGGVGVALNENGTSTVVDASEINTVRFSGGSGLTTAQINAPNLFGGDKKEGGIKGSLTVMMGKTTQVVPTWIKNLMKGRVPGFRGVVTMFFDGLVCAMNPYPKKWAVRIRRTVSGWDGAVWEPALATIWLRDGTIKAMNPAHIIYECLTNRDWGRGFSRTFINEPVWLEKAQILHDEGLGLCLRWNRQDQLSTFIQQVVDHIGGSIYPDRATGLINLDLLRGDYDMEELPLFTYDSGLLSIEESETASREDTVNEIIVNWHDPIQNGERQARIHNLASLQTVGGKNSTTTSYSGLPTVDLALRVAQRDMRASNNALARYNVYLDQRAWKLAPGALFRVSAPDKNIFNIVLRAGEIGHAGVEDGKISVEAVLDVFGLPTASFVSAPDDEWEAPDRTAVVTTRRLLREASYREFVLRVPPAELADIADTSGAILTIASKPSSLSLGYNVASKADGEEFEIRGAGTFVPSATIIGNVTPYQTVISFENGIDLGLVAVGQAVQIGDEICRVDDIVSEDGETGTVTLGRGCVDTIVQPHGPGTPLFFYGREVDGDLREYNLGENVDVKLSTFTSTNTLNLDLAPIDSVEIMARQARPWAPADLRVNGSPFFDVSAAAGDIALTWVHRDRLLIEDQLVAYDEASIGPEAGVTYTVRVFDGPLYPTPARTETGITGTGFTYTAAMRSADAIGAVATFEVEAVRAGIVSQYRYRFDVAV